MGFMKDVAPYSGIGLAANLLHKKKPTPLGPQPTMISNSPYERPMSMIGSNRGGY